MSSVSYRSGLEPPNPSIERTSPGKSGAASHLKRYRHGRHRDATKHRFGSPVSRVGLAPPAHQTVANGSILLRAVMVGTGCPTYIAVRSAGPVAMPLRSALSAEQRAGVDAGLSHTVRSVGEAFVCC